MCWSECTRTSSNSLLGFTRECLPNVKKNKIIMVEPLLSGIVLGLVPVTLIGLFVTAYLQYRRGDRITSSF